MTEHRRNLFVMDCMEANIWYNVHGPIVIAEAYLMRAESLTNYNETK